MKENEISFALSVAYSGNMLARTRGIENAFFITISSSLRHQNFRDSPPLKTDISLCYVNYALYLEHSGWAI